MTKQVAVPRKRPAAAGTQIQVRLQPDALARLDDWIERQKDELTRPEAMRYLMEQALTMFDHANRRKHK